MATGAQDKGVVYTEGPEGPNVGQEVVGTAPTKVKTVRTVVVQFRPMRLEEDGNDITKSQITVTTDQL